MTVKQRNREPGQILIIIALGLVVLLGFTSLAIDGGMIYSDRRQAQNAADAASLAGALAKANGGTDAEAVQAALNVIAANMYDPTQAVILVDSSTDLFGSYYMVRADLEAYTQTSLMHLFGRSVVTNEVMAISKTRAAGPVMPGMAIIAMGDCKAPGGPDHLISFSGGGNSGGVIANDGSIFINATEKAGQKCALVPGNSINNWGIRAENGEISSVGEHDYQECDDDTKAKCYDKISPVGINTMVNGGVRIGDPLYWLPEPQCNIKGTVTVIGGKSEYEPGNFAASEFKKDEGTLKPGIYCITGDLTMSGNQKIGLTGNGVVLYFIDGGIMFTGNAYLNITAPKITPCPNAGDPTAACTYNNIALFMARGQNNMFDLGGNGGTRIVGTVYALDGDVQAYGGGSNPEEWVVNGQVIARSLYGAGGGSFRVKYDANNVVKRGPGLSLTK
jgi:hypothetical protein